MAVHITEDPLSLLQSYRLSILLACLLSVLVLTRVYTGLRFQRALKTTSTSGELPILPYWIPWLGM